MVIDALTRAAATIVRTICGLVDVIWFRPSPLLAVL